MQRLTWSATGAVVTVMFLIVLRVQAEGAAGEDEAEGPEVSVAESHNGVGPKSGVQSHSLGGDACSEDSVAESHNGAGPKSGVQLHSLSGDACSEDEYEEAGDDVSSWPLLISSHERGRCCTTVCSEVQQLF